MIEITNRLRMFMSTDEEVPWSDNKNEVPWTNPTKNSISSVQVSGNSVMGQYTETNAILAMVLAALSFVLCGVCSAIPAVIIANGALQITSNQPGHPDHGLARAAQIMGWIAIGLTIAVILFYIFIFVIFGGAALLAGG